MFKDTQLIKRKARKRGLRNQSKCIIGFWLSKLYFPLLEKNSTDLSAPLTHQTASFLFIFQIVAILFILKTFPDSFKPE